MLNEKDLLVSLASKHRSQIASFMAAVLIMGVVSLSSWDKQTSRVVDSFTKVERCLPLNYSAASAIKGLFPNFMQEYVLWATNEGEEIPITSCVPALQDTGSWLYKCPLGESSTLVITSPPIHNSMVRMSVARRIADKSPVSVWDIKVKEERIVFKRKMSCYTKAYLEKLLRGEETQ